MATRRNALGRGLGALLPTAAPPSEPAPEKQDAAPVVEAPGPSTGGYEIPIDRIDPNPDQPRRLFEEAELERLAASIERHGVLQPVVVRKAEGDRYELVVGERRWRAAARAGCRSIPAVVSNVAPRDRLEIALVENVQRNDLNPIELALAFRALTQGGDTQEQVGERVGLDRSTVANHLRLLDLSRDLQEDVEAGRVSVGHAKALLQVSNPERRRHLHERILREGLSVRETEALARRSEGAPRRVRPSPQTDEADPNLRSLVTALREHLQTQVRISGAGMRGRIEIDYFSMEDLDRLTRSILGDA